VITLNGSAELTLDMFSLKNKHFSKFFPTVSGSEFGGCGVSSFIDANEENPSLRADQKIVPYD
jgi:hypothetical protein